MSHGTTSSRAAAAFALAAFVAAPLSALAQGAAPASASGARATAGSISGTTPAAGSADCAAKRKAYLDSQACFERYRLANGGLRAEASQRCRNVVDPSPRCGQNLPTK